MAVSPTDAFIANNEGSAASGNGIGGHKLSRMKLSWRGTEYLFAINPEDYTQSEPNKATITQTKGGAWIDAWGEGIKEITIKGTTGVFEQRSNQNPQNPDAGYQRWKALRDMVQDVYDSVQDGQKVELMNFYNFTDNEYFYVFPANGGIELYRSKARPYLYQYTLRLWVVRKMGQPEKQSMGAGDPGKFADRTPQTYSQQNQVRNALENVYSGQTSSGETGYLTQLVQFAQTDPNLLDKYTPQAR